MTSRPVDRIDHLVFWVRDLSATRAFYSAFLGEPDDDEGEDQLVYSLGDMRIFFGRANAGSEHAMKDALGFNHLAFSASGRAHLEELAMALDAAGHSHSGITRDSYGGHDFIWVDDPDGIRVELYARS